MLKAKLTRVYYDKLRPDDVQWRKAIETPGLYLRDYFLKRYPLSLQAPTVGRDRIATAAFPIDIVYTWVDHQDQAFGESLHFHLKEAGKSDASCESSGACRWLNRDELKYSLRSVDTYLPWINRIFIVTNGQIPAWLDTSHPKISIVTHDQIIDPAFLPTFNSHVIESALHHIPGLSEHYLYLNDDVMFLRPAAQTDFFSNDGKAYVPVAKSILPNGPRKAGEPEPVWAAKNARALVFNNSGYFFDKRFGHLAHPQLKSAAQAAEQKYADAYAAFRANKFRSPEDILTCGFLHHCEAFLSQKAFFIDIDGWYVRIRDRISHRRYKQMLKQKGTAKARLSLCANDHLDGANNLPDYEGHFKNFLDCYFPAASSFEKRR